MAITFDSDRIVMCTAKQKKYVRNLLKQYPSLGEPADYEAHTIRSWLDAARDALGRSEGHSGGQDLLIDEAGPSAYALLSDIVGDPLGDMMRDEYRNAILGGL